MFAVLQGDWFRNFHYSLLGYTWPTASLHIKLLVEKNVLAKRGHTKSAEYRLQPTFCPMVAAVN
jgi:hypothetical protein